jgi:hypothetical protein
MQQGVSVYNEFAESVINRVHALWKSHSEEYSSGYAVFYGPVHYRPELMLIGLNPGGYRSCFNGKKEILRSSDEQMEYLKYRNDPTYPIAGKTANMFDSIGLLKLLETSVKINLNFFRSKNWSDLSKQHLTECINLTFEIIDTLKPKVILCECLFVFDILQKKLINTARATSFATQKNNRNRRIYASITQQDFAVPLTIIGITHLTGSRPSKSDIESIGISLQEDIYRTITYTNVLIRM